MAQFAFTATSGEGNPRSGLIDALDREAAVRALTDQDLIVTKITRTADRNAWHARIGLSSVRIKTEQLLVVTQTLAAMLNAGINIKKALGILVNDMDSPALRQVLIELEKSVSQGDPLSQGMGQYPQVFPRLYVAMVEAGESSGNLPVVLNRLADHVQSMDNLASKVKGALIYPVIVIIFACIMVTGLLAFAVPQVRGMYTSIGAALPAPTLLVLAAGDFVGTYKWLLLLAVIILVLVLRAAFQTVPGRALRDRFLLAVPVVRSIFRGMAVTRFCRTLATLYESGVPILKSIAIAGRTTDNIVYENLMVDVAKRVEGGQTLVSGLRGSTLFSETAVSMIQAGEESGSLETMLAKLSDFLDEQMTNSIAKGMALIEPLLMIGVGILVGGLVMALALPFLTLSSKIM